MRILTNIDQRHSLTAEIKLKQTEQQTCLKQNKKDSSMKIHSKTPAKMLQEAEMLNFLSLLLMSHVRFEKAIDITCDKFPSFRAPLQRILWDAYRQGEPISMGFKSEHKHFSDFVPKLTIWGDENIEGLAHILYEASLLIRQTALLTKTKIVSNKEINQANFYHCLGFFTRYENQATALRLAAHLYLPEIVTAKMIEEILASVPLAQVMKETDPKNPNDPKTPLLTTCALSEAMKKQPKYFSAKDCGFLKIAQITDSLPTACENLAAIKRKILPLLLTKENREVISTTNHLMDYISLSSCLRKNICLMEAIPLLRDGAGSTQEKEMFKEIFQEMKTGLSLSVAMRQTREFPIYIIEMMKAGEMEGVLEVTLAHIVQHLKRQLTIC